MLKSKHIGIFVVFVTAFLGCSGSEKGTVFEQLDEQTGDIIVTADQGAGDADSESTDTSISPECATDEDCGFPLLNAGYCVENSIMNLEVRCVEGVCDEVEELVKECEGVCGGKGGGPACWELDCTGIDGTNCLYHGTTPGVCQSGACLPHCVDGSGCVGYTETSCDDGTIMTTESTCVNNLCVPSDPTETACLVGCNETGCLCDADADCDDSDPCTTDVCHNNEAGVYCLHVIDFQKCMPCAGDDDCGVGGTSSCNGENYYTIFHTGKCTAKGLCEIEEIDEVCKNDCSINDGCFPLCETVSDCDTDPATNQELVCLAGVCTHPPFGYCDSDAECSGSAWGPYCVASMQAKEQGYIGLCQECRMSTDQLGSPAGCNEGEKCSWGFTSAYNEVFEMNKNRSYYWCKLLPSECAVDANCDDNDPCTQNLCEVGVCNHLAVNNYIGGICVVDDQPGICMAGTCQPSECNSFDDQCDDGNAATNDSCAQAGNCNYIPPEQPWGCNGSAIDCTSSGGYQCQDGWLHFLGTVCQGGTCQIETLSSYECPGGCLDNVCLP